MTVRSTSRITKMGSKFLKCSNTKTFKIDGNKVMKFF